MNDAQDAVYVITEFSGQVLHFARDTEAGTLELPRGERFRSVEGASAQPPWRRSGGGAPHLGS